MSTFKVEMERQVVTTESASMMIEASSQEEAELIAGGAMQDRIVEGPDLEWKELVELAAFGDAVVTKVSLHSFDDAEKEPAV